MPVVTLPKLTSANNTVRASDKPQGAAGKMDALSMANKCVCLILPD